MPQKLMLLVMTAVTVLISLTVHEIAHGWIAYKMGDPTAKNLGRLTLDPRKHLDPIGTIMMLFIGVGYAKPVPVNSRYFKNPKLGMALTAAAGPAVNIIMSFFATALYLLFFKKGQPTDEEMEITDNLVYVGLAFMTIGMLFGALWAKEAWGHYWSWDPKETWAAITWFAYLAYIHYRLMPRHRQRLSLWMLIVAFILLQMCWWGINYLPSAQGSSVQTYSV